MSKSVQRILSMIRAIILDFSGTMFDDISLTTNIFNDIFERFGKRRLGFEEFRANFELPYPKIFLKYGLSEYDARETSKKMYFELYHTYEKLTGPFPQTKSCVELLSKAGYLLGIVSQTPREMLDYQLEKIGLTEMIPNSIALGEAAHEKPHPLPLMLMMERLGVKPWETMYVGDMIEDRVCAGDARAISVLVGNGRSYHTPERLRAANPDFFISILDELTEMLLQKRAVLA